MGLRYDAVEDRILLLVEGDEAPPAAVWLTQRLLRQLVDALAGQLSALQPQPDPERQAVQHRWRQSMASVAADGSARSDVSRAAAQAPRLVSTVRLRRSRALLQLRFVQDERSELAVTFSEGELRRWLSALHRLAGRAGWPLAGWPAWIGAAAAEVEAPERLN